MVKVGITGGIGSGKSIVCLVFKSLGIPVYDADFFAKEIMINNPLIKNELIEAFGESTYLSDGKLNKAYLAGKIFSDQIALQKMNSIVHPKVIQHYENWLQAYKNYPYTLKEAAILFESGIYKSMDYIITVTAPVELRIKRVMDRDLITKDIVLKKIAAQMPDEEKIKLSDYLIMNNDIQPLLPQVLKIHEQIVSINK